MADGRQSFLSILHLRSAERSSKNKLEFSVNVTPIQRLWGFQQPMWLKIFRNLVIKA